MNALFLAAVVCMVGMSAALPKRQGPGGPGPAGTEGPPPEMSPQAVSMALEMTQLAGKCELFYFLVAEQTGQTVPHVIVPEEFHGILAAVCPHVFGLLANKTEEEFTAMASDMAEDLPLVQCFGLFAEKEAIEYHVGDDSRFLAEAQNAFHLCETMFDDVLNETEEEMEEEEEELEGKKRSNQLKTILRELNNILQ